VGLARLGFLFLFFGQNGLHHVAGLRDVGEINFGRQGLRSAGRRTTSMARGTHAMLEVCANLFGLMVFK